MIQVKKLIEGHYKYPCKSDDPMSINITNMLINAFILKPDIQIKTAIILLAKKEDCNWTYKNIIPRLIEIICDKKNPIIIGDAVKLIAIKLNLKKDKTWSCVLSGETIPFTFEERGKVRYQSTHSVRPHQVIVLVDSWQPVDPVTVDRVGIYLCYATTDQKTLNNNLMTKARVVFSKKISIPGVPSVFSGTSTTIKILHVPANSSISVPLTHTNVKIRENYPVDSTQQILPAHTISLLPPVTLTNLLPHELFYQVPTAESDRIAPGCNADLHNHNIEEQLEITF
ncbi:hypothetical protein HCN44_003387 [Aphidius gifuensis]|uniref:Ig-like domain-containing protein n=1 Tax=Aphidius gifuensis TaxID=684658 RepID=A0A834XZ35_APHGI|nr:hypothetical protein HCN44_003387 [Aphidius gifuensis]